MISLNTVKYYCKDYTKIENYGLAITDDSQTWDCHHRNERFYSKSELIDLGLYYDCPPCELIFLTVKEHKALFHRGQQGHKLSEEHKKALSEYHTVRKASDETKDKMKKSHAMTKGSELAKQHSERMKGHRCSEETRRKMSEAAKKRKRKTDGTFDTQ